jgi:hypothetical protein
MVEEHNSVMPISGPADVPPPKFDATAATAADERVAAKKAIGRDRFRLKPSRPDILAQQAVHVAS